MFFNYIKTGIRYIIRNSGFSLINITGLAVGIATSILILLFVVNELSYDRFHEKSDRIYRIGIEALIGNTEIHQVHTPARLPLAQYSFFPEIEYITRVTNWSNRKVEYQDCIFMEPRVRYVDSTFFDIFTVDFLSGQPKTALKEPNSVVITEKIARKYFGDEDPMDKVLRFEDEENLKVTAVVKAWPANSHMHFDLLVSLNTFESLANNQAWFSNNFANYFVLHSNTDADSVEAHLPAFVDKYLFGGKYQEGLDKGNSWEYYLQPLTSIHLHSDLSGEFAPTGKASYIYIFFVVAIFILLIACINFMNLATAKSAYRSKEIGIRKVFGSTRMNLIRQFYGESILVSFISLILAIVLIILVLNFFPDIFGKELDLGFIPMPFALILLLILGLTVGIISGSYPALFLSSFQPVIVLKGFMQKGGKRSLLRSILVIFQFFISVILIVCTLVVYQQLQFLQNEKLGFDKENIIVVKNPETLGDKLDVFKQELEQFSFVKGASICNLLPGTPFSNIGYGAEDVDFSFSLNICLCDEDYKDVLNLEILEGRFFSDEYQTDSMGIIINEAAWELLGYDDPIDKKINDWWQDQHFFHVIGVIKDFHYESMHQNIRPMGLLNIDGPYEWGANFISVKVIPGDYQAMIQQINSIWDQYASGLAFDYSFLEQDYDALYKGEAQTRKLFVIFTILAIFIASLGLLGLASFLIEQKTKEIGIRKALGASIGQITGILTKEFVRWVIIANVLALPTAWYLMDRWLQNFEYRISQSWWIFVLASVISLLIALFTVSFQTIKTTRKNPIEALRYE